MADVRVSTPPPPSESASSIGRDTQPSNQKSTDPSSRQASPERLGSGSTEHDTPTPARKASGSVGSKSSESSRLRNGSLRKKDNDRITSTTPKRSQRQRPAHSSTLDAFAPQQDRKTSNFKVGNIGLGGRIYLRPVTKPATQRSAMPQSPTRTKTSSVSFSKSDNPKLRMHRASSDAIEEEVDNKEEDDDDDESNIQGPSVHQNKGTRTDFTGRESVWTKLSTHDVRGAPSDLFRHQPRPRRSMSESTADHNPNGRPAALAQTKALKVVIDRPESDLSFKRSKSRDESALDIPIPHYRIGTPRFSASGTPFLLSSVLNQSQSNIGQPSPRASYGDRYGTGPSPSMQQRNTYSPSSTPNPPNRRHSHAALMPGSSLHGFAEYGLSSNDPSAWRKHISMAENDIISPRIYDSLAAAPNDPSVIKYSPTGEVIAATPARLIVQITAETFLDYELLSDFFLTVRCYLSTHDLLALLLARFEWAVNRYDDNGRIIRVRSFAAIRHWILNYFAYDFVPDRQLRIIFCRKLNAIFKVVQSREELGASDMKLIADLKKCWNGRCVIYWERTVDNALEADILPGGSSPLGKTDSEELYEDGLGSVTAASTGTFSMPASPSVDFDPGIRASQTSFRGHGRTASDATSRSAPMSPTSDVSAPVMSCSIPALTAKKVVQSARQLVGPMPAGQRPRMQADRASVGSSEAVREAQSLERQNAVQYSLQTPVYRSVLRGHLLPPASPYVTTAPTTPGFRLQEMRLPHYSMVEPERKKVVLSGSGSGPGMKNLIGNIKRALSSKAPSTESYSEVLVLDNTNPPRRLPSQGLKQNANVPVEVLNRADAPNNAIGSSRAAMRIDSLAEQVSAEFQQFRERQQAAIAGNAHIRAHPLAERSMDDHPAGTPAFLQPPAEIRKLPSGMTSSSQSIVIFDDTGMTGLGSGDHNENDRTPRDSVQLEAEQANGASQPVVGHLVPGYVPERRASSNGVEVSTREVASTRSSAVGTPNQLLLNGPSHVRNASQASSLRRVASYQSALNKTLPTAPGGQGYTGGTSTPDHAGPGTGLPAGSAAPARGLRRVPGGDLRANQNIADLEPMPRPKSTGSIATFSSARESEMLSFGDRITKTFKRDRTDRPLISPGLTGSFDKSVKDERTSKVSFIRTHSEEKPNRRPSFEAVVASFAEIPDEDEGGIEATLMKLEGRYRKALASKDEKVEPSLARTESAGSNETVQQTPPNAEPASESNEVEDKATVKPREQIPTMASTDYARSEDSYNSTPLLERGADSIQPVLKIGHDSTTFNSESRSPIKSRDATKSFLLDEGDDDDSMSDGTFDTMDTQETDLPDNGLLGVSHPPSPPVSDEAATRGAKLAGQTQARGPPTPDSSPSRQMIQPQFANFAPPTSQTHPAAPLPLASGLQPKHMPFVLGHDSEVMFQQLTLIEKDALREIDWRDLVHMRWQHQAEVITNWVTYLATRDPAGIDLVTSRFNVMVKWAVSEIVLTEDIEERALAIIKCIHIAHLARRKGNFATLLQLTIALTSADCSRLKGTWALVPEAEKRTLAELEALVSPHRNFAALRSEMEDAPAESGCIPVLALYIHDLTYNSQKPAVIESTVPGAGLLVNFERYRTTAVVVKNLLRMIDASSKYNFVPVDDVLSHCMWMACLPDKVIVKKSKALEMQERIAK